MKKTVLITGGCRGLGMALAYEFYHNGYELILNSKKSLIINKEPIKYTYIKGDLREDETIDILAKEAKKKNIDILINNAGIYHKKNFTNNSIDRIMELLEVNLIAPIKLIKAIWPIFQQKQNGIIININSIAGKYKCRKDEVIYTTTKNSLASFSKSLRLEAIENNIKIMDAYLGAIKTDMTKEREDYDNLMEPEKVAMIIAQLVCKSNMIISEITINGIDK